MLDDIVRMAMEALELTDAQVDEARKALLAEVATVDARAAAADALWNPKGSTTRLENAVPAAQQKLSDHRDALAKAAPKFMALALAVEVARQRRDDAEKMLQLKWKAGSAAGTSGVPKEVVDWYPRLERHGVKRSYLGEFSNETVAIIADLIRWKAKDARFRDPDNPWRAVLGTYAERIIVQPGRKFVASLSTPGTPTKPRHVSSDRHYMFNEMFRELPPVPAATPVPAPPASVTFDCSVYPNDAAAERTADPQQPAVAEAVTGIEVSGTAVEIEPDVNEAMPTASGSGSPNGPAVVDDYAEYALPDRITPEVAAELTSYAEQYLTGYDDWVWDLNYEIDQGGTDEEVIARVRRLTDKPKETPYRYFVEAAENGGVAAGRDAYRQASVRRVMSEMITGWGWDHLRKRLGIT